MKTKDLNDIKTKNIDELRKKLVDLEKKKNSENLELKMGRVKNVHLVRTIKRDIAKIKTILKMKLVTNTLKNDTKIKKEEAALDSGGEAEQKNHAAS